MKKPWFENWFGDAYKQLYPHRDMRQAEAQAGLLLGLLPVTSAWRILDIGCGSGRHLSVLRRASPFSAGLDLSRSLLGDARSLGLPVVQADMRRPPFRPGGFDLVTCFFTSFGYFATLEEDVEALAEFVSLLKPAGYLFLDLINKDPLVGSLVPLDRQTVAGTEVVQRRRLEGDVVIKEIEIRLPDGGVERYEERVRLYGWEDILAHASRLSLRHLRTFGDEAGGPFRADASPRMSLLFQAAG